MRCAAAENLSWHLLSNRWRIAMTTILSLLFLAIIVHSYKAIAGFYFLLSLFLPLPPAEKRKQYCAAVPLLPRASPQVRMNQFNTRGFFLSKRLLLYYVISADENVAIDDGFMRLCTDDVVAINAFLSTPLLQSKARCSGPKQKAIPYRSLSPFLPYHVILGLVLKKGGILRLVTICS